MTLQSRLNLLCFFVAFRLELALFMTDSEDPTGKLKDEQLVKKRREEALPERILRRVLEGMGSVVDRRLGRTVEPRTDSPPQSSSNE